MFNAGMMLFCMAPKLRYKGGALRQGARLLVMEDQMDGFQGPVELGLASTAVTPYGALELPAKLPFSAVTTH